MLHKHIQTVFLEKLGHQPTSCQTSAIEGLSRFIASTDQDLTYLLKGYAGTGKTSLVAALIQALHQFKMKSVLLAPTGRAAKVLSGYANKQAYTIHKKIYRQRSAKDGFGSFNLDVNLHKDTVFIVDEASMIANQSFENAVFGSGRLLDDLIHYVFNGRNCKLILIGDVAQLPPVKMDLSPALNHKELEAYGLKLSSSMLKTVVRQSEFSGILHNATILRQALNSENKVPHFDISDYEDVIRLSGEDLVETISSSYDKYGIEGVMVVTRSNKRANLFNQGIRSQILWKEEEISRDDYIMVVKNNYFWAGDTEELDFIANGDIGQVVSIHGYEERYGLRFANITLRLPDYKDIEIDCKVMLDTLSMETPALPQEKNKDLFYSVFDDYEDTANKKKRYEKVKSDPFFNALQIKYAYAVTCHKAQGGQWPVIFVDHGFLTQDNLNDDFLRWLYTAFTRPSEKIYLVNFHKLFFEDH